MACPCASLHCCLTPLAAQNTPNTSGPGGALPSPGIRRFVVYAPEGKNTDTTGTPPRPHWPSGGPKCAIDGSDVTPTFSSPPNTSLPLLPLPPSRGTPSMQRSGLFRGSVGRLGMMRSGPRLRTGIDARHMDRPVQHHTFYADVADVRQIEQGLLQLMEDFQTGSLRAFGESLLSSCGAILYYLI